MGNPKAVVNKPIIAKNPVLIGSTFYASIYLNNSKDVMTQHVSQFGRETTADGIGAKYGYAISTGNDAGRFIRVRKNDSKKKSNRPALSECLEFSEAVDGLNQDKAHFLAYGLGTAAVMELITIAIGVPAFALAAIIAEIIGGLTGGGLGASSAVGLGLLVKAYCDNSNVAASRYNRIKDCV
ncbi:hypothetical protein GYN23_02120 [Lactococcus piscium]|nr:hypothetical protein [Lactococcus paracarnosus]